MMSAPKDWALIVKFVVRTKLVAKEVDALLLAIKGALAKAQAVTASASSENAEAYDQSLALLEAAATLAGQDLEDLLLQAKVDASKVPTFPLADLATAIANVSSANPSNTTHLLDSKAAVELLVKYLSDVLLPSFTSAPSEAWQDSLLLAKVLSGLLTAAIQAEAGVEKDGILKEVQQAGDFFLVELQEVQDRFHSLSELTEVEQKLKSIATASSGTLQQTLTQALDVTQFTELRLKNLQVETIPVESLNWEFTYKTSILNTSTLAALHHTEPDCFVSSQIVIPESTIDLPVERLVPLLQSQFPSWKMVNARKYVAGKSIADEKQRLFEEGVVAVFQDLSVMDTILISAFEEALGLPKGYVNRPVNFYRLFGTTKEEQGIIGANAFDLPSIWEALETRQRHTASISGAAPTGDLRFANGDALVGLVLVKRASDVDTNFTMAYAVQFVTEDAVKIKVQLKV